MALIWPLYAFAGQLQNIKPIKSTELMPVEEFAAKTQEIKEVPFGDQALAYQMRLPAGWQAQDVRQSGGLSKRVLGIIAKYSGPVQMGVRSYFMIEALSLDYEIDAKNWFINHILSTGYTLEALQEHSDKKVEAIYVAVERDDTYIVRVVAQINGPRIVLARYFVPQQQYRDEKVMQVQSLASFKLLNIESEWIEKQSTYSFFEQSYFDYPDSWLLDTPKILDVERTKVKLSQSASGSTLDGHMQVHIISKLLGTSLVEEVKHFRSSINIPGYSLGELIEAKKFAAHKSINFAAMEVYALKPDAATQLDYEMWIAIMESEEYYYLAILITSSRDKEFYNWARNSRAFQIVASSVRQYN